MRYRNTKNLLSKCLEFTTHANTALQKQTKPCKNPVELPHQDREQPGGGMKNTFPAGLLPAMVSARLLAVPVSAGAHEALDSSALSHLTYEVNPFSFGE